MTNDEAVAAVIDALEAQAIPYMLVGSLSSNFYGIPRSTNDADIVIELGNHALSKIIQCLGPQFRPDPQMCFETVTGTLRNILMVPEISFKIELFRLSDDLHDQQRFRRRQGVHYLNRQIFLPSIEEVIVTKLRWTLQAQRNKDWDDIRNVIAVQGDRIDWNYVHSWCEQHGTRATLDEIRASIPPL